jgi:hypothetical protein
VRIGGIADALCPAGGARATSLEGLPTSSNANESCAAVGRCVERIVVRQAAAGLPPAGGAAGSASSDASPLAGSM